MKYMVTLGMALVLGLSVFPQGNEVEAKSITCKDINKVYKGGVAEKKNWKNKGANLRYKKYIVVNEKFYQANKFRDRDDDGLVCER